MKNHLKNIGFTNRLAIYIFILIAAGLGGGFYLANKCINTGYTASLACWTIAFTPIGTFCSGVLAKIVDKSKAENVEGGIKYEAAKAAGFQEGYSQNSPPI